MRRKSTLSLIDQGVASATNFLTGVIIGRVCTKEQFGLYMLGFSLVIFVINLQTSLISTAYVVYSPRLKGSALAVYTGSTLIHQLTISTLAIIALATAGVVLSVGIGPQKLAPIIWTLVVVITVIMFREFARRIFFASLRMKAAIVLDSCIAVVQIGGLLLLAYLDLLSASRVFWVVGLASSLAAMSWLIWMRKEFTLRASQAISDFGRTWSFGKWVFAGNIMGSMSIQIYPWLLTEFHGASATGAFAACWGVVALVNPFWLGIGNILGPETVQALSDGVDKLRQVVLRATIYLGGVTGLFCLVILIFGDQFVALIYGNKYAGNGVVVSVMALSFVALAIAPPVSSGLQAMERPDVNLKVNLISLCMSLTVGLWLVKTFGTLGAALGLVAGNMASSVIRFIAFYNLSSTHHEIGIKR